MVYDGPVDWGKKQGVTCASLVPHEGGLSTLGFTLPRGGAPLEPPLPGRHCFMEIGDGQTFWS